MNHIPVLLHEVLTALHPEDGGAYIDATLGDGGHAAALLQANPDNRVLGIDQDPRQIKVATEKLQAYQERVSLVCSPYSRLEAIAKENGFQNVDGILFDLGFSSRQLSDATVGMNLDDDTPLDMRLSPERKDSAADFLNHANEVEIADVLYRYGDRHNSRPLARSIVAYRKKHRFQVAHDVKEALNLWQPAYLAPIFQALRIWVNKEYEEIEAALPQAVSLLKPGGTLAVITFHSGEDRLVKHFTRHHELLEVTKKIITPAFSEIKQNSRARSAKLRIAVKK